MVKVASGQIGLHLSHQVNRGLPGGVTLKSTVYNTFHYIKRKVIIFEKIIITFCTVRGGIIELPEPPLYPQLAWVLHSGNILSECT